MHCGALQCILGGFPKNGPESVFLIIFVLIVLVGPKLGPVHPQKKLATRVSIIWICAVKCTIDCALKHRLLQV